MEATAPMAQGYCPHCELLVEEGVAKRWPSRPIRCPHCQLLIGAGRGHHAPSGDPGTKGTAAGVFSRQAKREAGEPETNPGEVLDGIRQVAEQVGQRPERLLMVDYQQASVADTRSAARCATCSRPSATGSARASRPPRSYRSRRAGNPRPETH